MLFKASGRLFYPSESAISVNLCNKSMGIIALFDHFDQFICHGGHFDHHFTDLWCVSIKNTTLLI